HLAGEVSDGALSWLCPTPYLFETALPALRAGAAAAGRSVPPLVAHVPVALSTDRGAVQRAARQAVGRYAGSPFYARMFADAGYPVAADGTAPDALLEALVVAGDEETVRARLLELLAHGLDEVLVMLVPVSDETAERAQLAQLLGRP
ncbi:MAG: LLM class flavin-dependent oxidoreductase, partial [Thermomicrobiales bacterium]